MEKTNRLSETYEQSTMQLGGHGRRNAGVLKKAFESIEDSLESDKYGKGPVIEKFQDKMANFLGKEAAVFFPSGTMAQQIALRIWCEEKGLKKVAYHPLSHLEIHEEDGLKQLHQIKTVLLADKDRVISLQDVKEMENVACLLLELPQREIGGQLPEYETLEAISAHCRKEGIRLHLDGARLLEVLPFYGKTAAEVCALFDSVYVSVYKGIGGIAGAILAGDKAFTEQSKVWKRRHGGDLISLYPYIVAADYYFDERAEKMGQYYEDAKALAARFNACHAVSTLPEVPVSNMFHVHVTLSEEQATAVLADLQETLKLGITSYVKKTDKGTVSFELSVGDQYRLIPAETLDQAFRLLDEKIKEGVEA